MKWLAIAALMITIPAVAQESEDKTIACLPVAKAGWEAMVDVFDEVLSGKPKYEAAKKDPSETLLNIVERMPSAEDCALMIGLFGPEGIKALMLENSREDLANGKYPRIFD